MQRNTRNLLLFSLLTAAALATGTWLVVRGPFDSQPVRVAPAESAPIDLDREAVPLPEPTELVRAAKKQDPGVSFFGATGPELEAAGAECVLPTRDLSIMGLFEVVGRLPAVWRALGRLEFEAARRGAAGAVLVDSPDFNLRLAGRLARIGMPVVQYVSPTVWAWRPGRVRVIERHVRRLLVTLPFEPAFYADTGIDVVYVGNPAVDRIPKRRSSRAKEAARLGLPEDAPWVAPFAAMLRAGLAAHAGRHAPAARLYGDAAAGFDGLGMRMHAWSARHRARELSGTATSGLDFRDADWPAQEGIVAPQRLARVFAP